MTVEKSRDKYIVRAGGKSIEVDGPESRQGELGVRITEFTNGLGTKVELRFESDTLASVTPEEYKTLFEGADKEALRKVKEEGTGQDQSTN